MSTQRFMSRICESPGRFAIAILLGALLALQCLLPSAAFARSRGPVGTFSSTASLNYYVRDKVGVSVVRLIVAYAGATSTHQVVCTGLGILVSSKPLSNSQSSPYQNWVLTDGNLVKTNASTCTAPVGGTLPLNDIQIWASDEYAAINHGYFALGHLTTCSVQKGTLGCKDESATPAAGTESVRPFSSNSGLYTLFSFQSNAGEPYLTPDFNGTAGNNGSYNVGLTNRAGDQPGKVYPSPDTGSNGNSSTPAAQYLMPDVVTPAPSQIGDATASAPISTIESGTPMVDGNGQLIGMYVSNGLSSPLPVPVSQLRPAWDSNDPGLLLKTPPVSSAQSCVDGVHLISCWNAGIDALYGPPPAAPRYSVAHGYLSPLRSLNTQFNAPHTFDLLALQKTPPSRQTSTPSTSPAAASTTSWLLLAGLGAGLVLLVLLLLLVTLLVGRANRRRRELDRFAAEQVEAHRVAEAEVARQRAQKTQPQPVAEVACPNCRKPVRLTDAMCPYCRFPLSPTASGLNVRLMGNAALAPTPISEQPTVQFPPALAEQPTVQFPPAPAAALESETAARHQPTAIPQETVYPALQQVRGRNLSLAVGTRSDPGIRRKNKPNEDSLFAMQGARTHNSQPQQFGLFVVADGMGGHANGQDASRTAIQTMIDFMLPRVTSSEPLDDEAFLTLMGDGVQHANQAVHNRNMEARADMGTTMTAALVVGSTAYVANVGDSRTYLYRDGQGLSKVTNDHSVVASLVEAGIIQPDDIYTHPKRNQIYRSLGEKPIVEVDTFKVDLQPGDKLLLCSDGLGDMVRDPLIQQVLGKPVNDPNKTGQELIKAALEGGGEDNVSVIIAQFAEMNERTGLTGVQLLAKPESVTVPNLPPL